MSLVVSLWSIHASLSQSHLRNAYAFLQSLTVAKTIYTLDWHRCDAINKKILLIMINYTQKGSRIRVPFYDIELPTFTKVCVCCVWGRAEWECLLSPLTLLIIFISIFKLRYFNRSHCWCKLTSSTFADKKKMHFILILLLFSAGCELHLLIHRCAEECAAQVDENLPDGLIMEWRIGEARERERMNVSWL